MSSKIIARSSNYICKACRRGRQRPQCRAYGTNTITTNPSLNDIYDVVAVGGGPVGLALLTALSRFQITSIRVMLADHR